MSNYIQNITDSLTNLISELSSNPSLFLRNPQVNFTRNRKISFRSLIGITMNSGGGTMSKELLDYFDFNVNTPTVSAYTQQRSKVLPEAFEYLFQSFTQENISHNNTFKGYKLIACDGSNLTIATNPSDAETAYKSNQYGTITNHLHLNAFFDVLNRIYLDAVLCIFRLNGTASPRQRKGCPLQTGSLLLVNSGYACSFHSVQGGTPYE